MNLARNITPPQLHPRAWRNSSSASGEATQTSVAVRMFCARQQAHGIEWNLSLHVCIPNG